MLWIKALHSVFIASWFAGLSYLPRIYVNLAMVPADSAAERDRLLLMARKLYRFMTILAVPALALGLWLWLYYGIGMGPGQGWMHAKLLIVLALLGYHHSCGVLLRSAARSLPASAVALPVVVTGRVTVRMTVRDRRGGSVSSVLRIRSAAVRGADSDDPDASAVGWRPLSSK